MSLPVRERGLKSKLSVAVSVLVMSLPVRERGLKFRVLRAHITQKRRSPCGSVG